MNKYAIYHVTNVPYVYAENRDELVIKVRTAKGDIKNCTLYFKDRYDWVLPYKIYSMKISNTTDLFDYYKAKVCLDTKRYRYYFKFEGIDGEILYLSERGLTEKAPDNINAFQFPYLCGADVYNEVKWAEESRLYQIFPDRFNNGDKSNDPKDVAKWGDNVTRQSMFGGDIQGIIDKVGYLKDLGINIIYMTPIFLSDTNHKYNTTDYYKVDPMFGNNEKIKELVRVCHKNGIRILFDAVFNHSGSSFFAFQDVLKNGQNSKYKDWYFINSFPVDMKKVNYRTFADNVSIMPKLNTENPEVKKYLIDVAKYWVKEADIDGWRLDVCDEVDHEFWKDFKKAVKSVKKDAFIVGEIMHEAGSFLSGDQFDSIMNYPFKNACVDFFAKSDISAEEFINVLASARARYMDSINRQMLNLIGSHDTARFLTEAGENVERLKMAAAFQFTYIGIPYIYYGDEVGIDGGCDPENRKCMVWDEKKQNNELHYFYKKLNSIRKENSVLVYGSFEVLNVKNNIIAFRRYDEKYEIIVIINNNKENAVLPLGSLSCMKYKNLLNDENAEQKNEMELKPFDIQILKRI